MAIKLGDGVIQVSGDFTSFQAQIARVAGAAATAIGGAMVASIGLAVKKAVEFETAFAGVKKTVEGTDEELAKIREELLGLSREIPLSANELANIAEIAGQLGIKKDDIAEFTEVIAKLGFTTNLTGEEAAVMLAQFINITGLEPGKLGNLSDVIVKLGNESATSEKQIVELGLRIAAAGTISGIADEDILAVASAFASVGTKAEAGGTVISRVLLAMNDAVIVAGEGIQGLTKTYGLNADELQSMAEQVQQIVASGGSLSQLAESSGLTEQQLRQLVETMSKGGEQVVKFAELTGQSAQEFADAWKADPVKAFESVVLGLERITEEGKSMGTVLDDLGLKGVRIGDIMGRGALNADGLGDALTFARDAMGSLTSEMGEEFGKKLDTAAAQLQLLVNDVTVLAIEIGTTLLPVVRDLIDTLRPWVDSLIKLVKAHPEATKNIALLVVGIGALLAIGGPLIILIASWKLAFGGVAAAAVGATAGTGSLTAAITAATAAIVAATTAMAGMTAAAVAATGATVAKTAATVVGTVATTASTTAMVASTAATVASTTALTVGTAAATGAGAAYAGMGVVIDIAATSTAAATVATGGFMAAISSAAVAVGGFLLAIAPFVLAAGAVVFAIVRIRNKWVALKKAQEEVTSAQNSWDKSTQILIDTLEEEGVELDKVALAQMSREERMKALITISDELTEAQENNSISLSKGRLKSIAMAEAQNRAAREMLAARDAGATLEEQYFALTGQTVDVGLASTDVALAWGENNESMVESTKSSLSAIEQANKETAWSVFDTLEQVHKANTLWSPGTPGSPSAVDLASNALNTIVNMNLDAANSIFGILESIHNAFTQTWTSITDLVGNAIANIQFALGNIMAQAANVINSVSGAIGGRFSSSAFNPAGAVGAVGNSAGTAAQGVAAAQSGGGSGDVSITFQAPIVGSQTITSNMDAAMANQQMLSALSESLTQRGLPVGALAS